MESKKKPGPGPLPPAVLLGAGVGLVLLFVLTLGAAGLILGGVLYTVGCVFYLWRRLPYHHPIWHLFVLAGSLCHFFCVLWHVMA